METIPAPDAAPPDPAPSPPDPVTPDLAPSLVATIWAAIRPSERPAAWLAGAGGVLVLVAAITSSAARWGSVPVPARLSILLLVHAVIAIAAERYQRHLPSVSRVLAHLGAALAVPTGISIVATMHGSWRSCIVVGGLAGLTTLELQARRWHSDVMRGAQPLAVCVAAAGAAAITHTPVGALIAVAAVVVAAAGWERRAMVLAGLAAATPIAGVLAQFKVGPGTLAEIGARGRELQWGAPVAGALAAAVFLWTARRRRSLLLAAVGVLSFGANAAIGLSYRDIPAIGWACAVGVGLLGAEALAGAYGGRDRRISLAAELVEKIAAVLGLGVVATSWDAHNALPVLLLGAGWLLGGLRRHRIGEPAVPLLLAIMSGPISIVVQFGWTPWALSALALELAVFSKAANQRLVMHAAGIVAVGAAALHAVDANVSTQTMSLGLLITGAWIVAAGLIARRFVTSAETTGLAAMTLGMALQESTRSAALAIVAVGLGVAAVGFTRKLRPAVIGGLIGVAYGLVAFGSTYDLSSLAVADIVAGIAVTGAAIAEHFIARRDGKRAEFLASSLVAAGYLLATMIGESGDRVRLAAAFGIALLALPVGVLTKRNAVTLAALAVGSGALLVMSWAQLATLPMWAWIGLGGLALIAGGIAIEHRRSRTV